MEREVESVLARVWIREVERRITEVEKRMWMNYMKVECSGSMPMSGELGGVRIWKGVA